MGGEGQSQAGRGGANPNGAGTHARGVARGAWIQAMGVARGAGLHPRAEVSHLVELPELVLELLVALGRRLALQAAQSWGRDTRGRARGRARSGRVSWQGPRGMEGRVSWCWEPGGMVGWWAGAGSSVGWWDGGRAQRVLGARWDGGAGAGSPVGWCTVHVGHRGCRLGSLGPAPPGALHAQH